jgi:hypothetical protein
MSDQWPLLCTATPLSLFSLCGWREKSPGGQNTCIHDTSTPDDDETYKAVATATFKKLHKMPVLDTDVLTGLDRDTERRLSIVWTIGSVCSQQRSLGKLDALCTFAAMEDRLAKRLQAVA